MCTEFGLYSPLASMQVNDEDVGEQKRKWKMQGLKMKVGDDGN